jgi:hypothetical protein
MIETYKGVCKCKEDNEQNQVKAGYHLVEPNPAQIPILVKKGYKMIAFSVDIRMLDSSARIPFNS